MKEMVRTEELLKPFRREVSTASISESEYRERQCESYNSTAGTLDSEDGINCDLCRNKGDVWFVRDDSIFASRCPECTNVRQGMKLIRQSGLVSCSFESFKTERDWQKKLYELAYSFAETGSGEWLFLGGQSGCGKTHLCSAALKKIIMDTQCEAEVFRWAESAKLLKGLINDSESYERRIGEYKNAPLLYIDDFLKVKRGEEIKPADINLAFEIIDARACRKLRTLISSEHTLDDIINADEATGSRIKELCGKYALSIRRDAGKNRRLAGDSV